MAGKAGRRDFGYLRKRPSGTWQASFIGPDGRRILAPHPFTTKSAGEGWLRRQELAKERADEAGVPWEPEEAPKVEPVRVPTFGEYAETYLARRTLKPHTVQDYRRYLDRHLLPQFGALRLDRITRTMVADWYSTLCPGHKTQRAHVYALGKAIMLDAVRLGRLDSSPFVVRGAGQVEIAEKPDLPTRVQVDLAAGFMPERTRLAVLLAVACGFRSGEVRALQRGDVDLARRTIRVERGVTQVNGAVVVAAPKTTASLRTVAYPLWLDGPVRDHLAAHVGPRDDAWLFPGTVDDYLLHGRTTHGVRPLSQTAFNRQWLKARALAGLGDLTFHRLRHWAATTAVQEAGASEHEAGAMLGHRDSKVIRRYLDRMTGRAREIADRMPEIVGAVR